MGESIDQPIQYPGERIYPEPTVPDPELDALFESESAEIEEVVHAAATYAQDPDIILGSSERPVLSDRAQKVLSELNRASRAREEARNAARNPRDFSTNSRGMIRQFGSLTVVQRLHKRSKS